METGKLMDMVEVFEGLEDWRNAHQTRHRLSELLTIAVCAVLSGADDFEDISQWGRIKLPGTSNNPRFSVNPTAQ